MRTLRRWTTQCSDVSINPVEDKERWAIVGRRLGDARRGLGLSKRAAALAAGISEGLWRQLEAGSRSPMPGVDLAPNPRDENLIAAARAVGVAPDELFYVLGRQPLPAAPGAVRDSRRSMAEKLARLGPDDLKVIEHMVDRLLDARSVRTPFDQRGALGG